jgi:hypothetical protein
MASNLVAEQQQKNSILLGQWFHYSPFQSIIAIQTLICMLVKIYSLVYKQMEIRKADRHSNKPVYHHSRRHTSRQAGRGVCA